MQQLEVTMLDYVNRAQAKKAAGVSYLGGVATSAKIVKNQKLGVDTFILYLAPSTSSGYQVCPKATADCINACLNESGHNRIDTKRNTINHARIAKTKLFYEEREFFMAWLVDEIKASQRKAHERGNEFTIRINGTSDLSPELFKLDGKTLLEIFPDVQFYDYTKVYNRVKLLKKYNNYDLTFSFSGYNWDECETALANGMRVAMVFEKVPAFYKGLPVINGDETDLRYLDAKDVIVGLKFKKVRNKIDFDTQKFIIPAHDEDCVF